MMHRYIRHLFWALLAVVVSWSTVSQADTRVALVIGNGAYQHVPQLPNPPKDAKALAALLRNLGFDVVSGEDLDRNAMTAELRKFADKANNADVAMFFYAGHGLQLEGENYLLPVDSNPKTSMDVKLGGGIDINVLLNETMSTAKVKLVFLDACRDNPFVQALQKTGKSRSITVKTGLAEMKAVEGTLLAFATSPGQVALDGQGGHSPFTKALLDNLGAPNTEISTALTKVRAEVAELTGKKQLPWENTNLTGLFYMNKTATADTVANDAGPQPAAAPSPAVSGDPVEMEFWRTVKDSYKPEELNAYLTRYPNGSFSPIARARLASLQDAKQNPTNSRALAPAGAPAPTTDTAALRTEPSSSKTEEALNLDRTERGDIQRRLKALGFATATNGRFRADTRRAIKNWQGARNYFESGYLNQVQWDALRAEPVPKEALAERQEPESKPAAHHETRTRHRSSGGGNSGGGGGGGPPAAMGAFFGGVAHGLFRH
jgi:uncharacterized caspase-like protein